MNENQQTTQKQIRALERKAIIDAREALLFPVQLPARRFSHTFKVFPLSH